jgi:O-antigen/teichoic acid export membrane protein
MVAESWPLMLSLLLQALFPGVNVLLLQRLQGDAVVGWYDAARKWVDALNIIPSFFTIAVFPVVARLAVEDREALRMAYRLSVKMLVAVAFPTAILVTLLATPLVGLLSGSAFLPHGAVALRLMVWSILFGWINSLTNYVLVALDQQARMKWAFLAGVSFNVVTNLLFVPLYGFQAAAVTTILSELVLLIAFYRLLRRALGAVNWVALLWRPSAAGACMAGTALALWSASPLLAVLVSGALYAGVLWLLRPFTRWELSRVAPLLPQPLQRILLRSV